MPEKEITEKQAEQIRDWVREQRAKPHPNHGSINKRDYDKRWSNECCTQFTVKGEPLAIILTWKDDGRGNTSYAHKLLCSDNHAKELQQEKIVEFPELQEKK